MGIFLRGLAGFCFIGVGASTFYMFRQFPEITYIGWGTVPMICGLLVLLFMDDRKD